MQPTPWIFPYLSMSGLGRLARWHASSLASRWHLILMLLYCLWVCDPRCQILQILFCWNSYISFLTKIWQFFDNLAFLLDFFHNTKPNYHMHQNSWARTGNTVTKHVKYTAMNYDPLSPNTLFMKLRSSAVVCLSVIKLKEENQKATD